MALTFSVLTFFTGDQVHHLRILQDRHSPRVPVCGRSQTQTDRTHKLLHRHITQSYRPKTSVTAAFIPTQKVLHDRGNH